MKVIEEKIENRQAYLTIEMEPPDLEEGLKKAYSRLVQKYVVPGFRKGKAPRYILEQYLGTQALTDDAVEHMASEAYKQVVKEKDLRPVAQPHVDLEKVEPVTYKMIIPLEPTVQLGDYHKLKMQPESVELKEEDIDRAIEQLRHEHATWDVVDRQVNSRDTVTLEIESTVETLPYINQKDAQFVVEKESEFPIKGFSEQLIGLHKGETKEFKLNFATDYGRSELAGKEVNFKVAIKEIKQEHLPDVNDELAQKVNPEFKTAAEMRLKVAENLKKIAEDRAKLDFEQKVVDEVVNLSQVDYPPVVEEDEIDSLIRQQMRRWQLDEKGMDEYLKSIQKTAEQIRDELRPVAVRSIKQSLVLTEAAKAEGVKIEKADLDSEIETMTRDMTADRKDQMVELLTAPQAQFSIVSSIATRKIIEKLAEMAKSPAEETENITGVETQPETVVASPQASIENTNKAEARPAPAIQEEGKQ